MEEFEAHILGLCFAHDSLAAKQSIYRYDDRFVLLSLFKITLYMCFVKFGKRGIG